MNQSKTCSQCKQTKPLSDYHKSSGNLDGHRNKCKACTKALDAERYLANQEQNKARALDYYYANQEQQLAKHKERRNRDPIAYAARRKQNRLNNPTAYLISDRNNKIRNAEKRRARAKQRDKENPEAALIRNQRRRARLANVKNFEISVKEIKKMRASLCFACGASGPKDLDHIIPISKNGDNGIGNLTPLCEPCNASKYNKTWMEWRMYRIKINEPLPMDRKQ